MKKSSVISLKESNSLLAPVNKIIPFSNVDGPGNRTAIFLQGCNYNCKYCHNPETRKLCIHCGLCVDHCPVKALTFAAENGKVIFHPEKCVQCDTCLKICPHDASPRIRNLSPEETFAEIQKQVPYIRGITVSGGECTLYPAYLTALFQLCKKAGLSTLIDSNGTYDFRSDPELLAVTDGVMLDLKSYFLEDHLRVTDQDNKIVLENAVFLAQSHKLFEVRTVVVPDLFNAADTILQIGKLLVPYLPIRYKIIAFRPMGVRKEYAHYHSPSEDELRVLANSLEQIGWKDIILI